jgi:hypothetical protein
LSEARCFATKRQFVGGNCIVTVLNPRLTRFLFRVALAFEPLAPTAISYFLSRTARDWKEQGQIRDYAVHTKRLGKFHYRIELELEVNQSQVHHFFAHVLPKYSKTLGRWFNV